MYKKILVPLDGSELAEQVLPHVSQLAGCTGAEIVLLRVPSEPVYDYLVPDPDLTAEVRRDIEMGAQVYLDEIASELRAMNLNTSTVVVWGAPVHDTIVQAARELKADLIAMSTHGRSGLARMVIGSVADEIVRHAPAPVLLVRPEIPRVEHAKGYKKSEAYHV
ncbi:MAG: universal stress protein [Chloroflexi bacterium]|nr:universal stress protein [Chloroflexota bacterium]